MSVDFYLNIMVILFLLFSHSKVEIQTVSLQ